MHSMIQFLHFKQELLMHKNEFERLCTMMLTVVILGQWQCCDLYTLLFFIATWLRYNSHTVRFTLLKCTIQWWLVYSQSCATITTTNFKNIFLTPSKFLCTLVVSHHIYTFYFYVVFSKSFTVIVTSIVKINKLEIK